MKNLLKFVDKIKIVITPIVIISILFLLAKITIIVKTKNVILDMVNKFQNCLTFQVLKKINKFQNCLISKVLKIAQILIIVRMNFAI